MIPIYGPDDIRPHMDIANLIPSAEQAFQAISDGTAHAPLYVLHPSDKADIHVKSAVLPGCPIFTVKMAGWSQVLLDQGEPPSSGMIVVFDSETCKPIAILQDDHLISDYRTAAAGAVVAQTLAPPNAETALIVGTGRQARLQVEALLLVRPIKTIEIWGRNFGKARALSAELSDRFSGCDFKASNDLTKSTPAADVIVTATSAKEPVIRAEWVRPGQHITSVGADDATKCEIAPEVLAAARVFVDAISSGKAYGNTRQAISVGLIDDQQLIEIGTVLKSGFDRNPAQITIASLSGLGIQDLMAVNQFWGNLTSQNRRS